MAFQIIDLSLKVVGGRLIPNLIDNQSCHLFYYHIIEYVSTNFFLMFVLPAISHRSLPFFNLGIGLFGSTLMYF